MWQFKDSALCVDLQPKVKTFYLPCNTPTVKTM